MEETIKEELDYLAWTKKITERLRVVQSCIITKKPIAESDYDVMEEMFRVYNEGRLPFYHRVMDGELTMRSVSSMEWNTVFDVKRSWRKI